MSKHYILKDGKLVRTNPFCPRCGKGVFMADHGAFWACGKCGNRYNKKFWKIPSSCWKA
ncbi:MAG: 30S ribosomal protein S27ae [Thermoproteota archaeon]|nr:30S ribosomal protein S27ae [Thermoproteota archaeon]